MEGGVAVVVLLESKARQNLGLDFAVQLHEWKWIEIIHSILMSFS